MKKAISLVLAVAVLTLCGVAAFAAEASTETATVYVTLSDAEGKLVLTQEAITVTDVDGDGKLTIHDALYAAHEAKFDGGAAAGYGAEEGAYGLAITKLWGEENGGSYGYYVNNASAWSLTDSVVDGDYVNAFVYTDLIAWSDTFCFFDVNTIVASEGDTVELSLMAAGYDASYNPITVPVEGATITVNGVATDVKTDAQGKASVKLDTTGKTVISATSETQTLVPPVCVATVATGATTNVYVTIADAEGKLALAQEAVTVTDVDGDGKLTIHDALYAAHEAKFDGGAAAGYGAEEGAYGLAITKLWGEENGGSYGYYVNNASAWSLTDSVVDGDYVNAFVYTDLIAWSDTFCFFDVNTATVEQTGSITLTLSAAGYDASYNPITVPVEGATITVDGVATEIKTDGEGKATLTLETAGVVVISATSETQTLVPPACKISVTEKQTQPTEPTNPTEPTTPTEPTAPVDIAPEESAGNPVLIVCIVAAVALAAVVIFVVVKRRK